MIGKAAAVLTSRLLKLVFQGSLIHADAHAGDFQGALQMLKPEKNIAVQLPVVIVRRTSVMGLAAGQFVANLHQEHTAVLPGNQVFPCLRSVIRIQVLKLLAGDKVNIFGKMFDSLRVFIPHLMLHVLDNFEDLPHRILQGVQGALLLCNDTFPVPLVHITGVKVIQLLVPADGVHVGVKSLARLKAVFL